MTFQHFVKVSLVLAALVALYTIAASQVSTERVKAQQPPPAPVAVVSGPQLYRAYCASCHGVDAKGNGPAASALKKAPPDLTRIATINGGTFPMQKIEEIISGDQPGAVGHGSREMPVWGPVFGQIAWDQDLGKVRIHNLAKYLESLQR
jgi:mono/diheme cytochrome c family protein